MNISEKNIVKTISYEESSVDRFCNSELVLTERFNHDLQREFTFKAIYTVQYQDRVDYVDILDHSNEDCITYFTLDEEDCSDIDTSDPNDEIDLKLHNIIQSKLEASLKDEVDEDEIIHLADINLVEYVLMRVDYIFYESNAKTVESAS